MQRPEYGILVIAVTAAIINGVVMPVRALQWRGLAAPSASRW
jgi:hypothetical protein